MVNDTNLAVSAIAIHGIYVKVGAIRLRREAVVVNVDPGSLNSHN